MADLSALGELKPIEQLDLSNYSDNKESTFRLPEEGKYTLRAPDAFPTEAFTRAKNSGALLVQIDPTIQGPTHEGFTLRYTRISAKPFQRSGKTVSQVGDYLRACGVTGVIRNEQDVIDLASQTANTVYEAKVVWRAFNPKTNFSLQGMAKFPKNDDGTYQSWVEDPTPGAVDEKTGKAYKVRANLTIDRFIPQGE